MRNPLRGLHGVYNLIDVISSWIEQKLRSILKYFQSHMSCSVRVDWYVTWLFVLLFDVTWLFVLLFDMSRGCLFYCLICHVVVRFIDVGGIVDHRFLNTIMKHHMLGEGQLLLHIMNGQYQHCFRGRYTQKVKTWTVEFVFEFPVALFFPLL